MKTFQVWGACAVGKVRAHQEDAIGIPGVDDVRPDQASITLEERCWAVVADGVGGNAAGEVASELAVAMMASVLDRVHTPDHIRSCLKMVNDELRASMLTHAEFAGMATTIVGAVFHEEECHVFNLGDSRAYLLTRGRLRQVSRDHSADGFLTGCLGGSGRSPEQPHVATLQQPVGASVVLCTDGLTNMLSNERIERELSANPAHPAKALVDSAVAEGGHDNVSVVVIQLLT